MANARGKQIDNTHLSIDQAENRGFLHRDYIAHCLRWSHVAKYVGSSMRYKTTRILDIGAGVDLPLAKLMYSSRFILEQYVGLDYNPTHKLKTDVFHSGKMKVAAYGNTIFPNHVWVLPGEQGMYGIGAAADKIIAKHKLPTVITCFEVLEHVEPEHARDMLKAMHAILSLTQAQGEEAVAFISTPCYDEQVGAAANHVSEIKRLALGAVIEDLGFVVEGNWGTFASMRDYKDQFLKDYGAAGSDIWDRLSTYYDTNYLATILAPMYPQGSRNNLWQIRPKAPNEKYARQFPQIDDVPAPWTSSARWSELKGSVPSDTTISTAQA